MNQIVRKKMYKQDLLNRAWFFASKAHKNQKYPKDELPYITHVGQVMMEVMVVAPELDNPELALLCAILHDTVEDTEVTYELLVQEFSLGVADGVVALSKNEEFLTKQKRMLDSLERIKKQPKEIWVVKMADRVSNLGEPPLHWSKEKITAYKNEAKTILDYFKSANKKMAERLIQKIDEYERYC